MFLGSMCLKIVVERWFWKFKMLFGSLVELHALLHSYLCFSLLEKLILFYLDTSSIPSQHLAIYQDPKLFLIAISIDPRQLGGSIEQVPGPSIAGGSIKILFLCLCFIPRQLHLSTLFFSTPSSRDGSTPLDTSICWELLRIYIKGNRDPNFIFSWSLSRYLCFLTSQITFSHSKPLFKWFSSFFKVFLHLVCS